jgi:hypothetical protein
VRYCQPLADSINSVESAGEWLIDFEPRDVFLKDQPLDLKELAPFGDAIESIYFSYQNNIIVLRDGLDALSIKRCAELVARVLSDKKPAIVSRSIFERMVRFYNPFLYTHLVTCRMVAYGKDVLPDVQPPSRAVFIIKVLEQTANILTFPQSHELILQSNPDWFAGRLLDSVVERALFIKLYLENRMIKPWHARLVAECREHYPQYYNEFCELRGRASSASASSLSEESFRLLKGLANDVHKDLMESNLVLEELFRTRQDESNMTGTQNGNLAMMREDGVMTRIEKGSL